MTLSENDPSENHVGGAIGRVCVDKSTTAVAGSEMKDDLHAPNCPAREIPVAQIAFEEFNPFARLLEVLQPAARKIVGHSYYCTKRNQTVDEVATDEGSASSDEDLVPFQFMPLLLLATLAVPHWSWITGILV